MSFSLENQVKELMEENRRLRIVDLEKSIKLNKLEEKIEELEQKINELKNFNYEYYNKFVEESDSAIKTNPMPVQEIKCDGSRKGNEFWY